MDGRVYQQPTMQKNANNSIRTSRLDNCFWPQSFGVLKLIELIQYKHSNLLPICNVARAKNC